MDLSRIIVCKYVFVSKVNTNNIISALPGNAQKNNYICIIHKQRSSVINWFYSSKSLKQVFQQRATFLSSLIFSTYISYLSKLGRS